MPENPGDEQAPPARRPDRSARFALPGAALLAAAGIAAIALGHGPVNTVAPRPPVTIDEVEPAAQTGTPLVAPAAYAPAAPLAATLRRSEPTHLRISRVGIETDLMGLGLNPDGTVEVPPDTADAPAGWYRDLASPGEDGPAVILGHLDSPDDRGVFFNLGAMRAGDVVTIERRDGSTATFTVDMVAAFTRGAFPTAGVYGATDHPGLRLITCGGKFSPEAGYSDSVVVFAALTDSSTPARDFTRRWWR